MSIKNAGLHLNIFLYFYCVSKFEVLGGTNPGVGKVRPAGQIWPAKASCPARLVV